MKYDNRYIQNETSFLEYSRDALGHRFVSASDFDHFYSLLPDNASKNEFLRVASFYLFLVKNGNWINTVGSKDSVTDYLTNSYKLVGIFSLIESLSEQEHQDFFRWLCSYSKKNNTFPIESRSVLDALFTMYNREHGATNFCVAFFERLSEDQQAMLRRKIQVRGKPVSTVKRAVQVLYGLRSRFVHEGNLLVQLSNGPMASIIKKKVHLFNINISEIVELFEHALVLHFAAQHNITLHLTTKTFAFAVC